MNKLILAVLFNVLIINHSFADNIQSPLKTIRQYQNYVYIEGRWKQTTPKGTTIIPKINTAKIICNKMNMTCNETVAKLTTPKDSDLFENKLLFIQEFTYEILSFRDGIIVAKREAPVADVIMKISINDKLAEKSFRETKTRGSETANPDVYYHWILE